MKCNYIEDILCSYCAVDAPELLTSATATTALLSGFGSAEVGLAWRFLLLLGRFTCAGGLSLCCSV